MQQASAQKLKNHQRGGPSKKSSVYNDQAKDMQQQHSQLEQQLQSEFRKTDQLQHQIEIKAAGQQYTTTSWHVEPTNTAGADQTPATLSTTTPDCLSIAYPIACPSSVQFASNVPIGYPTAPLVQPDRMREKWQGTASSDLCCFNCKEVGNSD